MNTTTVETGYVGSLTQEQEEKLLQIWAILLRSCDSELYGTDASQNTPPTSPTTPKQRRRLFSLGLTEEPSKSNAESSPISAKLLSELEKIRMNAQEIKSIQQVLTKLSPKELRSSFFEMIKQDHPDAFLLRFLRAEKWDVSKGFVKLVSALEWRTQQMQVDKEVIRKGELYALQQSQSSADATRKKDGEDFLAQLRMGKGYFHGVDKSGRPICVVRARLHKPGVQSEKALNAYIVHSIEQTLIFDLTGFSLSNMVNCDPSVEGLASLLKHSKEYAPVKFILQCFQENYPESLGTMLFYNAPWFFSGIWRVIRAWMDPIVAAKVHFVNSVTDLENFIDRTRIVKELGGDEDWEYEYVEPEQNENAKLSDTTTRDAILAQRQRIGDELFNTTSMWASAKDKGNLGDASLQKGHRADAIKRLRENYWMLDPYVRSCTLLDRIGVIQDHGKIDFYPDHRGEGQGDEKTENKSTTQIEQVENASVAQVTGVA
ncbi:hypothetical protein BBP40_004961 [Aspergillus hancockii]|nr:hypothetical protein BBP40_004961 [Aspergillus hancockii]